jgi:hypothetical protein
MARSGGLTRLGGAGFRLSAGAPRRPAARPVERGRSPERAPVLHLRRVAGGDMVTTYIQSFERVWDGAISLE